MFILIFYIPLFYACIGNISAFLNFIKKSLMKFHSIVTL